MSQPTNYTIWLFQDLQHFQDWVSTSCPKWHKTGHFRVESSRHQQQYWQSNTNNQKILKTQNIQRNTKKLNLVQGKWHKLKFPVILQTIIITQVIYLEMKRYKTEFWLHWLALNISISFYTTMLGDSLSRQLTNCCWQQQEHDKCTTTTERSEHDKVKLGLAVTYRVDIKTPIGGTRSPAIAEGPRDAGVPVEIW